MKNSVLPYLGLGLVILVFAILFIPKIFNRLNNKSIVDDNRTASSNPLSYVTLNGEAKKIPEFALLNQDSLFISNEDFRGKVHVVEFFFTRCPSICPVMNKNMKRIEVEFGKRDDFGIASFTIDPKYDTPKILKEYAALYDVFSPHWHFLTGDIDSIYNLANSGFNIFAAINPNVAGGFEHQGYFALIDKKGYIRSRADRFGNPIVYYSGVDEVDTPSKDVDLMIEDIKKLLKE